MDDREVVAAIMAGDYARVAVAYDKYAAAVYGYCQFMLRQPADATEALLDTFVIATTTLAEVRKPPPLRPWLYAVARKECRRRLRRTAAARGRGDEAVNWPADAEGLSEADLRTLVRGVVAGLAPRQREVIELSLRQHLADADLPMVLGTTPGRARTRAARARGKLEKPLATLIADAGPEARPALDELLVGWGGQRGGQTDGSAGDHLREHQTPAAHRWNALSPVALGSLPPPAALPPRLREQVLWLCTATTAQAVAYRRQVARRARPRWLTRVTKTVRHAGWASIRANPGGMTAAAAVVLWAVAAAAVTAIIFAGSHPAHTAVRPSLTAIVSRPAAVTAIRPAPGLASASARPSPTLGTPPIVGPPTVEPSASPIPNATPLPPAAGLK